MRTRSRATSCKASLSGRRLERLRDEKQSAAGIEDDPDAPGVRRIAPPPLLAAERTGARSGGLEICHLEINLPRRGHTPVGLELECAAGRSITDLEQRITVRPVLEFHRVGDAPVEERCVTALRRTHGSGRQLDPPEAAGSRLERGALDTPRFPEADDCALWIAEYGRARDACRLDRRCHDVHLQGPRPGDRALDVVNADTGHPLVSGGAPHADDVGAAEAEHPVLVRDVAQTPAEQVAVEAR